MARSVTLERNLLVKQGWQKPTCIKEQMVVNFKRAWKILRNLVMKIWLRNVRPSLLPHSKSFLAGLLDNDFSPLHPASHLQSPCINLLQEKSVSIVFHVIVPKTFQWFFLLLYILNWGALRGGESKEPNSSFSTIKLFYMY